jgi:hypothetical protein
MIILYRADKVNEKSKAFPGNGKTYAELGIVMVSK